MKVLLDTNIVLDYILERQDFVENARQIFRLAYDKKIEAYFSANTITDIFYIVRKYKPKDEVLCFLQNLLSFVDVANVNKTVILKALNSNFPDFEDAVQNFSAINSDIKIIVTRNLKDFNDSHLKYLNQHNLLNFLNKKTFNSH